MHKSNIRKLVCMCQFSVLMLVTICVPRAVGTEPSEGQWPQFRGPTGLGQVAASSAPKSWDDSNVEWSADLPVDGHSSPIIWEDKIFLTGATAKGNGVQRNLMCVARTSGKLLWNVPVATGSGEKLHNMNSWATPSCATDGKYVVAFFGPGGLHCYDTNGKHVWSRQLGDFPGGWGVGGSPIIVGNQVIQNCDSMGESFLLAVDIATGDDIWNTTRQQKPRGGWSTPVLIATDERSELLLNGEFGVRAYDPQTGLELWNCKSFNGRGTPMPIYEAGVVCVVNGKSGDVYAVRPGGTGDVTDSHMAWHTPRGGGRDLPSPVAVGHTLVVINMGGLATGYDLGDGEELWKLRLGGNYSGSPIVIGDSVYALSESGETVVIQVGSEAKVVNRNELSVAADEVFRSSPAVVDGKLYLRSNKRLYCIAQ